MTKKRIGICCAGNWIIDHVKTVSCWPDQDTLSYILSEEIGTGGSPFNVLVDLARFQVDVPLVGIGVVGSDADGEFIRSTCKSLGIDTRWLQPLDGVPTAYTDVMTVEDTGRRTFFHHRGANDLLEPSHFPLDQLSCRILNLGYLLLLGALDCADEEFGTRSARILSRARELGIETCIDVVSENSDRFATVVKPALRHVDYCIINELEAGRTTGITIRRGEDLDVAAMHRAADALLDCGVGKLAVIHTPEVSLGVTRAGSRHAQATHLLPPGYVKGTAGAGDAFLAGMLVALHDDWGLEEALRFANAAAASCLRHPTTTGGVGTADEIKEIMRTLPLRPLPVP